MTEPPARIVAAGGARFTCQGCTHCCRSYDVPIADAEEAARIEALVRVEPDLLADPDVPAVRTEVGSEDETRWYTGLRADGRCVFLTDAGRCALHERHGERAKPEGCRRFPYRLARRGERVVASLSFECAGVHRSFESGPTIGAPGTELARLVADQPPAPFDPEPAAPEDDPAPPAADLPAAFRDVLEALGADAAMRAAILEIARPALPWAPTALRAVARAAGALAARGGQAEPLADPTAAALLDLFIAQQREGGRADELLGSDAAPAARRGLLVLLRRLATQTAGGSEATPADINRAGGYLDRTLDGLRLAGSIVERLAAIGAAAQTEEGV